MKSLKKHRERVCPVCLKRFLVRSRPAKTTRYPVGIRRHKCVTCSRPCARIYARVHNHISCYKEET